MLRKLKRKKERSLKLNCPNNQNITTRKEIKMITRILNHLSLLKKKYMFKNMSRRVKLFKKRIRVNLLIMKKIKTIIIMREQVAKEGEEEVEAEEVIINRETMQQEGVIEMIIKERKEIEITTILRVIHYKVKIQITNMILVTISNLKERNLNKFNNHIMMMRRREKRMEVDSNQIRTMEEEVVQ